MKIAYLFLNGELRGNKNFYLNFIKNHKGDIYCADGGANICYELNLIPNEIYGDLDSIQNEVKEFYQEKNVKFLKFQVEKDYTDSELVLNEIQNKYDLIYCIAGLGGSIDHELTNINLLAKYNNLIFISENEKIFKVDSDYEFNNMANTKISFIIFSDEVKTLTLKGFKYNIENLDVKKGEARCISNIIVENKANLSIKSGSLLCVIKEN
ncbi:thiamine diphosphokinase [Fusobacterium canifelinum]|uniref:Thiamine diphosphokinase n=1 Tax=Fusobacterium canifelinum TaxID=285729 RepID=A0A3P1V557_9FUSO|nr:thiamine diphosphokinase [Fusobacterium canifelinum]QQB73324.1 thiamine diphosphokinase [Fusobacterium canifelinum]QQS86847.1 thiamine diphosphokinase [Fusobacterium canifelinum]RRD28806.1 thiamine diphosphokinase [Fusobacterium canifelinum]